MGRPPFRRAGAALAAALLVAACGDDSTTTADDTRVDTPVEETTTTDRIVADETDDEATSTTTAATEREGTLIEVAVRGGQVQGGGRTQVSLGETVTIRVTSDVDDHVHLHGYDVLTDVHAGGSTELVFTADIPGVFEVELEDARIPLLELEIS